LESLVSSKIFEVGKVTFPFVRVSPGVEINQANSLCGLVESLNLKREGTWEIRMGTVNVSGEAGNIEVTEPHDIRA